MTCIVWDGEVMATDRRMSVSGGSYVTADDHTKIRPLKGYTIIEENEDKEDIVVNINWCAFAGRVTDINDFYGYLVNYLNEKPGTHNIGKVISKRFGHQVAAPRFDFYVLTDNNTLLTYKFALNLTDHIGHFVSIESKLPFIAGSGVRAGKVLKTMGYTDAREVVWHVNHMDDSCGGGVDWVKSKSAKVSHYHGPSEKRKRELSEFVLIHMGLKEPEKEHVEEDPTKKEKEKKKGSEEKKEKKKEKEEKKGPIKKKRDKRESDKKKKN